MTKLELMTFKCPRCSKLFWSWFEIVDSRDKEIVEKAYDRNATFGDIILRDGRLCKKCRKGLELDQWFDLTEDFGLTT